MSSWNMADELSDYSVDIRYPNEMKIDEYKTEQAIIKMDFLWYGLKKY